MSWSVQAVGKAPAVALSIAADFARQAGNCREPEETIKNKVADALAEALVGQAAGTAVKVSASGSMNSSADAVISNSLSVQVEVLYYFVE